MDIRRFTGYNYLWAFEQKSPIFGTPFKSGMFVHSRFLWTTQPNASILKISVVASSRLGLEDSKTPSTCVCVKFGSFWAKLRYFQKTNVLTSHHQMFNKFFSSLNCNNLAQNHPNFTCWGCFGILRTSSCWWALRFLRLMHPGLRNWRKREGLKDSVANCIS